jgi:serine/threonine-protein kinase
VRDVERLAELHAKLPLILSGKAGPVDAAEALDYALLAEFKELHGASARLYVEAFRSRPDLIEDMSAGQRYNAACAAAMAGCSHGKDDPPLDDAARTRWRRQAIDWLRSDLAASSRILENGPPQARRATSRSLRYSKLDPFLAGLRDSGAVEKLPKEEQEACRALWKAVDALLARAGGGSR